MSTSSSSFDPTAYQRYLDIVATTTSCTEEENRVDMDECRAYFNSINKQFLESIVVGESGVICGLNNIGNTCYFGSGMQSLLACSQFLSLLRLVTPTMTASVEGKPLVNGMPFSVSSDAAYGTIPYTIPAFPLAYFESATNEIAAVSSPSLPTAKRAEINASKHMKSLPVVGDAHSWVNLATKGLFNNPTISASSSNNNPDQLHFPVWAEFQALVQQMRYAGNTPSLSPVVLLRTLSTTHPQFEGLMQQDSGEMVHQVLSSINDATRIDARSEDLWRAYFPSSPSSPSTAIGSSSYLGEALFNLPKIPSSLLLSAKSNDNDGDSSSLAADADPTGPISLSSLRALQVLALQNRINLENTVREGVEVERKATGKKGPPSSSDAAATTRLLQRFHLAGQSKYLAPMLYNSALTDPFTGFTLSAITCGSCGSCSRTYQSFNTLPLAIPKPITRARYAALHPEYVDARRRARDYELDAARKVAEGRFAGTAKALGRTSAEVVNDDDGYSQGHNATTGAMGWGGILQNAVPDNTVTRAVIASTQIAHMALSTPPLSWAISRVKTFPDRINRRLPSRVQSALRSLSSFQESAFWWLFVGENEVSYRDYIDNNTGKPYSLAEVDYPLTLDECLRIHFGLPETLRGDNNYLCEVCGVKGVSTKETKLLTTPKYFIIQLMRFGGGGYGGKDTTDVVFPMGCAADTAAAGGSRRHGYLEMPLDLLPHCATGLEGGHAVKFDKSNSNSCEDEGLLPQDGTALMPPLRGEYSLCSVINHHGSTIDGGHYTACSKRRFVDSNAAAAATTSSSSSSSSSSSPLKELLTKDTQMSSEVWLHLDDEKFTQVTRGDVINTEGYMLVYERDESRPLGSIAMEVALDGNGVCGEDDQEECNTTSIMYNADSVDRIRDYYGLDCRPSSSSFVDDDVNVDLRKDLRSRIFESTAGEARAQVVARALLMDPRFTGDVSSPSSTSSSPLLFSRGWLATAATTLEPGPVLTHPTTTSKDVLNNAHQSNNVGSQNNNNCGLIKDPALKKVWYMSGTSPHGYRPLLSFANNVFNTVFLGSSGGAH